MCCFVAEFLLQAFPNVYTLDLSETMLYSVTQPLTLTSHLSNARELLFDKCFETIEDSTEDAQGTPDALLFDILQRMPKLRRLAEFVLVALKTQLSRLSLRNNVILHGNALINMPAADNIEDLDLCMCRRIDADTMTYVLTQFPHLQKLSLYRLLRSVGL